MLRQLLGLKPKEKESDVLREEMSNSARERKSATERFIEALHEAGDDAINGLVSAPVSDKGNGRDRAN